MIDSFIIDANILFSGFLSKKDFYYNFFNENKIFIPDFSLIEINKYKSVILKKSKTSHDKLKEFTLFIFNKIVVVPDFVITEKSLNQAIELCNSIDLKDSIYIALSIELNLTFITRDVKLYNGLLNKNFNKIILFEDFIEINLKFKL